MARLLHEANGVQLVLIVAILLITFTTVFAQNSPDIQDGRYNAKTKAIEINVRYGGGCAEHTFQLQMGACRETYPVQCDGQLIDLTTNDFCEAYIGKKVLIAVHDVGLDNEYYKGASIVIHGAGDSKALIILPQ